LSIQYSDLQLDALRELANIGSGTASTALSSMLARAVDISVPKARVLPFAEAVEATGPPEAEVTGIVLGVTGELVATVLLLVPPADAGRLVSILGVDPGDELAASALGEIGNVVGTSYLNALADMTGIEMEPTPRPPRPTCSARSSRASSPAMRSAATSRCCWTPPWRSRARTAPCRSSSCPTRVAWTCS